jgi:hypothetical protein
MAALRETNTDSAFFESRNPEGLGRNPDKSRGKVRFA